MSAAISGTDARRVVETPLLAAIHHRGRFAAWSVIEARPLTTGTDRAGAMRGLTSKGVHPDAASAMMDLAEIHGSSVPTATGHASASEVLEANEAGAFGEEVPMDDVFRFILIDGKPL